MNLTLSFEQKKTDKNAMMHPSFAILELYSTVSVLVISYAFMK